MSLLLDAGAFIAVERGERMIASLVKTEERAGREAITHGGIIGQVWRGARQVAIARLLLGCTVVPLDETLGRRVGLLLAKSRTSDVHDAALVLLAADGDMILTSDAADLSTLAAVAGVHVELIEV